jgi:hypothetical protein
VETSSPAYELTACIACGSNESIEIADAESLRGEVEALWAFHGHRLRPSTPPERLMDRVSFSEHPPIRLVECARCGLVYRNPIERTRELESIYADATPAPELLRALHETQLPAYRAQARRLLQVLGRRGSGLEVGSYVGGFLAAAREVGLQFEGVDVGGRGASLRRRGDLEYLRSAPRPTRGRERRLEAPAPEWCARGARA